MVRKYALRIMLIGCFSMLMAGSAVAAERGGSGRPVWRLPRFIVPIAPVVPPVSESTPTPSPSPTSQPAPSPSPEPTAAPSPAPVPAAPATPVLVPTPTLVPEPPAPTPVTTPIPVMAGGRGQGTVLAQTTPATPIAPPPEPTAAPAASPAPATLPVVANIPAASAIAAAGAAIAKQADPLAFLPKLSQPGSLYASQTLPDDAARRLYGIAGTIALMSLVLLSWPRLAVIRPSFRRHGSQWQRSIVKTRS